MATIGKSAPIILTSALLTGLTVIEGREPYHVEPRQYEEPSRLTYEIATSTATAVTPVLLFSPFDLNSGEFK